MYDFPVFSSYVAKMKRGVSAREMLTCRNPECSKQRGVLKRPIDKIHYKGKTIEGKSFEV